MKWFDIHFKMQEIPIEVVLLTDDVQNREKAVSESIRVSSSKNFLIYEYLIILRLSRLNDSMIFFILFEKLSSTNIF